MTSEDLRREADEWRERAVTAWAAAALPPERSQLRRTASLARRQLTVRVLDPARARRARARARRRA